MLGARIRLARDAREVSQAELARRTGMSSALLCRCESDDRKPRQSEIERIAEALDFPTSFFGSACHIAGSAGEVHFRKKSSALAGQRRRAVAELNLGSVLAARMLDMSDSAKAPLSFEAGRMRDYNQSPTFAAYAVRRALHLPPGPIRNLTRAAEAAGIFVFLFDMGEDVMGLSQWVLDRPPVVCINSRMPGDRYRWTLAHELGHLALHTRESDANTMEREANEFGAELLMPRDDIYASLRGLTVRKMRRLKPEWGVAMQAMLTRAYELGLMSEYERSRHFVSFSKRGWRTREPEPLSAEGTTLVPELRRELASHFGSTSAFAESIGFPEDILARLTAVTRGPSSRHLRYIEGGDAAIADEQG